MRVRGSEYTAGLVLPVEKNNSDDGDFSFDPDESSLKRVANVVLLKTTAALLGAGLLSAGVALIKDSYLATLSAAVCLTAFFHYGAMIKVNMHASTMLDKKSLAYIEFLTTSLRVSDWSITLPLLALELIAVARAGGQQVTSGFSSPYYETAVAALAFGTIFFSTVSFLFFHDFGIHSWTVPQVILFVLSLGSMSGVFAIVCLIAEEAQSTSKDELYVFLFSWLAYPFVAAGVWIGSAYGMTSAQQHCAKISLYGLADMFSKVIFAIWVCVKVGSV